MLKPHIVEIIDSACQLKGNRIFTSLEGENPGGSMKDHMVKGEIESLLRSRRIFAGNGISEVSAGSTAAALAHYCPRYGLKCLLFVPSSVSSSVLTNLQSQGAEVHQEELSQIYAKYDSFLKNRNEFIRFNQLFDSGKRQHYHNFGSFLRHELKDIHAVIGGVGTGHSLRGIAEGIGGSVQTVTAEPDSLYKIPGVRNITQDRYGDEDKLSPSDFSQRLIIPEKQMLYNNEPLLETSAGLIEMNPSFALVLAAAKTYLADKMHQRIFTVGANLKRTDAQALRQSA